MNGIPKWRCPRIGEKYYKLWYNDGMPCLEELTIIGEAIGFQENGLRSYRVDVHPGVVDFKYTDIIHPDNGHNTRAGAMVLLLEEYRKVERQCSLALSEVRQKIKSTIKEIEEASHA